MGLRFRVRGIVSLGLGFRVQGSVPPILGYSGWGLEYVGTVDECQGLKVCHLQG
jgi:hypothetical protein